MVAQVVKIVQGRRHLQYSIHSKPTLQSAVHTKFDRNPLKQLNIPQGISYVKSFHPVHKCIHYRSRNIYSSN